VEEQPPRKRCKTQKKKSKKSTKSKAKVTPRKSKKNSPPSSPASLTSSADSCQEDLEEEDENIPPVPRQSLDSNAKISKKKVLPLPSHRVTENVTGMSSMLQQQGSLPYGYGDPQTSGLLLLQEIQRQRLENQALVLLLSRK